MIQVEQHGPIKQLKMGRDLGGQILYWVAAYLVDGLLIDSGCHHTAGELVAYLQKQRVEKAYLTHYHEDHIGGCALLQNTLDLPLYARVQTISLINSAPALYPYQELVWGYPEPARYQALETTEIKTDNYRFQVIETPGHSADHTVIYEPNEGWCFSGDLFVSESIKVLRPEEDIRMIMESMRRLLMLTAKERENLTLFTAIGKIVPDGRKALAECLAYLEGLSEGTFRLHDKEGFSVEEIVTRLLGGESTLAELTDGQFASRHLINSFLTTRK